jgi:hypothetical protein
MQASRISTDKIKKNREIENGTTNLDRDRSIAGGVVVNHAG